MLRTDFEFVHGWRRKSGAGQAWTGGSRKNNMNVDAKGYD